MAGFSDNVVPVNVSTPRSRAERASAVIDIASRWRHPSGGAARRRRGRVDECPACSRRSPREPPLLVDTSHSFAVGGDAPSTFGSTPCEPRTRAHATRVTGVIACRAPARTGVLPAESAFRLTRARNASGNFEAAFVPRVTARTRSASEPVFEHPSSRPRRAELRATPGRRGRGWLRPARSRPPPANAHGTRQPSARPRAPASAAVRSARDRHLLRVHAPGRLGPPHRHPVAAVDFCRPRGHAPADGGRADRDRHL